MYWTSANTVPAAVAGLYLLPDAPCGLFSFGGTASERTDHGI